MNLIRRKFLTMTSRPSKKHLTADFEIITMHDLFAQIESLRGSQKETGTGQFVKESHDLSSTTKVMMHCRYALYNQQNELQIMSML